MPDHSQEDYLKTAKRELGLTWDELAAQVGIHPRALKTYRMPVTSKDHRALPSLAKRSIDQLLEHHRAAKSKP